MSPDASPNLSTRGDLDVDLGPAVAALGALGRDGTRPAGAVVGVMVDGLVSVAAGGAASAALGDRPARPMTVDTRFDLASVTKLASSTAIAMRLVAAGVLDLDARVEGLLAAFGGDQARSGVTVRQLLEHTSGLPPWVPLYCRTTNRDEALALAAATPLTQTPGARWVYSDLGLIVLGAVIEEVTGQRQDAVFAQQVAGPLGLRRTSYGPVPAEQTAASADSDVIEHQMVATGDPHPTDARVSDFSGWRTTTVVGQANDGNTAHALGGVAGHAGLFGTVPELLRLGRSLVDPEVVPEPVLSEFTRPLDVATGHGLGLRLAVTTLAGQRVPFAMHPGFTGTWLAVALDRDLVIAASATRLHTTTGTIDQPLTRRADLVSTDAIAATTLAEVGAALESADYPLSRRERHDD